MGIHTGMQSRLTRINNGLSPEQQEYFEKFVDTLEELFESDLSEEDKEEILEAYSEVLEGGA